MDAIKLAKDNAELCDNWFEESPLHHLAIWEWNHENKNAACLLFLADVLTCRSKESYRYLIELLEAVVPRTSSDIKSIFEKIAVFEYKE